MEEKTVVWLGKKKISKQVGVLLRSELHLVCLSAHPDFPASLTLPHFFWGPFSPLATLSLDFRSEHVSSLSHEPDWMQPGEGRISPGRATQGHTPQGMPDMEKPRPNHRSWKWLAQDCHVIRPGSRESRDFPASWAKPLCSLSRRAGPDSKRWPCEQHFSNEVNMLKHFPKKGYLSEYHTTSRQNE